MKMLRNESILYQTKNKRFTLTNFRLREEKETSFGKIIKSIMLDEITACEMRTISNKKFLKWAISYIYLHKWIRIYF